MLEVSGKKADNIQSSLFFIFMEAKTLLNSVSYYSFIKSNSGWNEIDNLKFFKKYPHFLSATIMSLRHQIIVDIAKLFDNDHKTINLEKLFNQCEQTKRDDLKELLYKYKKTFNIYRNELNDYIKTARDNIYAHIDYSFNVSKTDKYDEFMLEKSVLERIIEFLKWILNVCIELSVKYDGDLTCLRIMMIC